MYHDAQAMPLVLWMLPSLRKATSDGGLLYSASWVRTRPAPWDSKNSDGMDIKSPPHTAKSKSLSKSLSPPSRISLAFCALWFAATRRLGCLAKRGTHIHLLKTYWWLEARFFYRWMGCWTCSFSFAEWCITSEYSAENRRPFLY